MRVAAMTSGDYCLTGNAPKTRAIAMMITLNVLCMLQMVFQQNQHITKLDYEEVGPIVVHRKCC